MEGPLISHQQSTKVFTNGFVTKEKKPNSAFLFKSGITVPACHIMLEPFRNLELGVCYGRKSVFKVSSCQINFYDLVSNFK